MPIASARIVLDRCEEQEDQTWKPKSILAPYLASQSAQAFPSLKKKGRLLKECNMESPYSVNSPRRTLSLSKQRRATVSFLDPDDKNSGFGLSGDHGPKPSEVYGFVGSITTVVATVIFLVWAYVPESWLQSIGISYFPSRYWALAVPTYVMVTIVLGLIFYVGLNFISTPSPASINTVFNEFSRDPLSLDCSLEPEKPIEPISDIGLDRINDIMFNNAT